MRIAITGASGFVAAQLIPYFTALNHPLLLFSRDRAQIEQLYNGHTCRSYETFETDVRGCDAIIHAAVMNNNVTGTLKDFQAANVGFAVSLAQQARKAGVGIFINLATLQAIHPPFRSSYAQSKFEALQALNQLDGIRIIHLQLPAVYADTFRGKLAVLNGLPSWLRQPAFKLLAALKPTLHGVTLGKEIERILQGDPNTQPREFVITDGQRNNQAYALLQRVIDLGFCLGVIAFLWWVLLAAWVAVRLSSAGPVVFAQVRIGRYGKPFTCYKFRTMVTGAKQAATHEMERDVITGAGRFLRRTKIDELPQIINIFRNEMSLIGPRPCLESQHALIEARRTRGVLDLKPGISGLAQVQGIDMSNPEELAALDAEYLARQSIALDLKIILATLRGKALQDRIAP